MATFILRKMVYGMGVMLGVAVLVFILFQGFGDPVKMVMGQSGDSLTKARIKAELYLDEPKATQFLHYLNDISPISFYSKGELETRKIKGFEIGGNSKLVIKLPYLRKSYQSKRDVWDVLMQALPGTLMLASAAMLIAICIGIPLGVLAATHKGTWLDTSSVFASILGISVPSFFMGIVLAYVFGFLLTNITGLSISGNWFYIDETTGVKHLSLQNLILPAITLGIRPLAIITQLTRSAMLDVLSKDYIRTAYAKGLSKTTIVWKHALKNALNPVITAVTGWFAELLAGAFFVEYIFGWQGIGKVTVDALEKLDYPILMGSVLLSAFFFVLVNIMADVLYGLIDPRTRVY